MGKGKEWSKSKPESLSWWTQPWGDMPQVQVPPEGKVGCPTWSSGLWTKMKFTWTSKLSHLHPGAVVGSRHLHCSFRSFQRCGKCSSAWQVREERGEATPDPVPVGKPRRGGEGVRQSALDSPCSLQRCRCDSAELE